MKRGDIIRSTFGGGCRYIVIRIWSIIQLIQAQRVYGFNSQGVPQVRNDEYVLLPVGTWELAEGPEMQCPQCGGWIPDYDGFGVLYHALCGYCTHPSIIDNVCDCCGQILGEPSTQQRILDKSFKRKE